MLRSRRLTLVAAAVLIGLSGCGDNAPRSTAAQPPAVIHLSGVPAGSNTEKVAADRMMMPIQDVTFVFDGSAPDLGADALAWTLPGAVQLDPARIAEIAQLLGVDGEVRAVAADQGGGWMVGAADYSTATLTVSADALSTWWFNQSPAASANVSCVDPAQPDMTATADTATGDTATGDTATGDTEVPVCSEPTPPMNVPDEATARTAAEQLFADMGYASAAYEYEIYADEWGANVTAFLLLDGRRSPISMSVGFGAEGIVTWASGSFATPQSAATYPLVGVDAAVTRLNDDTGRWSSWGGPNVMARMEDTVTGEANVTDVAPAPLSPPTEPGSVDAASTVTGVEVEAPMPVEAITVHLTGATLALTMVWAQDGTIWLLPAYTFTADDGGTYTVIGVDDSFIDLPAPFPTESLPIDSAPVESIVPTESTSPADSIGPVDSIAVDADEAAKALVGASEEEAAKVAADRGWGFRVAVRDGVDLMLTWDYWPGRVNVEVSDGAVVAVSSIG